jgi:hypothetical protein
LSSLFPDTGLCLEINKPKRVMVKFSGNAEGIAGETVELLYAGGAKAKEPKFRF